jgi:hypothetical protein
VNSRDHGGVGRAAHHDAVPAPAAPFLYKGCEPGLAGVVLAWRRPLGRWLRAATGLEGWLPVPPWNHVPAS